MVEEGGAGLFKNLCWGHFTFIIPCCYLLGRNKVVNNFEVVNDPRVVNNSQEVDGTL